MKTKHYIYLLLLFAFIPVQGQSGLTFPPKRLDYSHPKALLGTPSLTQAAQKTALEEEYIHFLPNMDSHFGFKQQKQIVAHPFLNTVVYANRQEPIIYGGGISGHFRYSVSTDAGQHWTIGIGVTNADAQTLGLGRYPEVFLFTNTVNPSVSDLKLLMVGPVRDISGSEFHGQVYNTVTSNLTNVASFNVTQEDYVNLDNTLFNSEGTQQGFDSGIFWRVDESTDSSDSRFYVHKGSYDVSTAKVEWVMHDTLQGIWNTSYNGNAYYSSPNIAFSPDGMKGYIVSLGDMVGGKDSVYNPVVWEYDYLTDSWLDAYEVNINAFPELKDSLIQATNLTSNGTATTAYHCDLTVDANGKPHILSVVGASGSGDFLNPVAYSIHKEGLQLMDITLDAYNDWNMIQIKTLKQFVSFSTTGTGSGAYGLGTAGVPHLSRTTDGNYLFYTWLDTDSANSANSDLWGAMYDVQQDLISPPINRTSDDSIFSGMVNQPKTAEYVLEDDSPSPCGRRFIVPTVSTNLTEFSSSLYVPQAVVYFKDITYDCGDDILPATWFYNCKSNPAVTINPNILIYPDCNTNNGLIQLNISGGVPVYSKSFYDFSGNAVTSLGNNYGGLEAGIYTATVEDSRGCSAQTTILLSNANSAITTVDTTVAPHCFNSSDGSAVISLTGGTPPYSISWSSGDTTFTATGLSSGAYYYFVTDSIGCISPGNVFIESTPPITVIQGHSNVFCFGDNSGSISFLLQGVAPLSIVWNPDIGTGNPITGLPGGTYLYTVTDSLGCFVEDSIFIEESEDISATWTTTHNSNPYLLGPWDGACTVNLSGGTPPYIYSWSMFNSYSGYFVQIPNNPGSPTVTGLPTGTLVLTIEDTHRCKAEFNILIDGIIICTFPFSIEELTSFTSFTLFPNPASSSITATFSLQTKEDITLRLLDLAGKVIETRDFYGITAGEAVFDTGELSEGVYLLEVITPNGIGADKVIIRK